MNPRFRSTAAVAGIGATKFARGAHSGSIAEIADQALAMRSGFPIGFTSNPDMQREAGKEAAWNSDLRRYLPNREVRGELYPFTVKQKPPKE